MKSVAVLFLFVSLLSCRQSSKIPEDFDYGKTDNGVYRNTYFDMEVTVPSTWAIQTKEQMEKIGEEGKKAIAETNKELAEKIKTSNVTTAKLFAAFRYESGTVIDGLNSSIMIMAENVRRAPGIKKGTDYLEHVGKLIRQTGSGFKTSSRFDSKKIGNKEFDVLKVTSTAQGIDIKQLYIVRIDKGFALVLIVTYDTDEQENELMDILHDIKFT